MKKIIRKPGSGGTRPGAGKPLKYGEPTELLRFRVPVSKVPQVKKLVADALSPMLAQKKV